MKKLILAVVIMAGFVLSSCGVHSQLGRNLNMNQTNVELSQNNYRVIGNVEGEAQATYIVGIGGLSQKALQSNAHAEMMKNANLTGSQAVINTTVEVKRQVYTPLYMIVTVKSYGQVIEFTK